MCFCSFLQFHSSQISDFFPQFSVTYVNPGFKGDMWAMASLSLPLALNNYLGLGSVLCAVDTIWSNQSAAKKPLAVRTPPRIQLGKVIVLPQTSVSQHSLQEEPRSWSRASGLIHSPTLFCRHKILNPP